MLLERKKRSLFEQAILPYMDAAYNLARWIMNNDQDAEDMVQESYLRAYKYFTGYQGGNPRAWLLTIVRNTCYTWLRQNQAQAITVDLDEELYQSDHGAFDPELLFQNGANNQLVRRALEKLPAEYRELIILRELEGLSYKEIATITSVPMGTVMSRLARARLRLKECLAQLLNGEDSYEL